MIMVAAGIQSEMLNSCSANTPVRTLPALFLDPFVTAPGLYHANFKSLAKCHRIASACAPLQYMEDLTTNRKDVVQAEASRIYISCDTNTFWLYASWSPS